MRLNQAIVVLIRHIRHTVHMPGARLPARRRAVSRWIAAVVAGIALIAGPLVAVPTAVAAPVTYAKSAHVPTADLTKFQPGNIISDAAFFNSSTMTEGQIQAFLEARVPNCQSGYTCLKDWYDTSRTTTADAMCGAYSGGVRERASRIIYKVAQACGINPQVILATLEKEQGLVRHTWPSEWRYTIAMGQGCPDTAACDTRYYGFFNQVYGAAWQFKRYANPAGTSQYFTWYAPGKTWNVRYNPNESCGSSPVYIQNQATANLYYYTPYQPNAAALRAGYGTGDGCSAYGNRNFYNFFTDWFGSAQAAPAPPAVPPPPFNNLDETPHVTALSQNGTIWAYPFSDEGRWGSRVSVATGATGIKTLLSPGDMDGDGRRDLIGVDDTGKAYLWRGDGATAYRSPSSVLVDFADAVLITDAGDFSGDGVPDVFTTTPAGALLLWRGTGTGGFRQPIQVGSGWGVMDLLSGGADMTGDGVTDLLARDSTGRLWLYPGTGEAGFAARIQLGHGWSALERIFVPGNFSGTSDADIAAMAPSGELRLYQGTGGGRIRQVDAIGTGWQHMAASIGNAAFDASLRTHQAGAGDIDVDGYRDVLAVNARGELVSYRGNGQGGWAGEVDVLAEGWRASDRLITLGDFSGDGESDIGRIDESGRFFLMPSAGASAYGAEVQIGHGWASLSHVTGGLDVDGDGFLDVLAIDAVGKLMLYRGDGRGGWASGPARAIGSGWLVVDELFGAGDFDGDGAGDLLARRSDDLGLWLYPTNGSGAFLSPRRVGSGWGGMVSIFSPGQFDGKGGPDVIAVDGQGSMYLYRTDGGGAWSGPRMQIGKGWSGVSDVG